jgi:phosphoribosylformimino-5-aminoimidazole carboxamide ribonucleotide (ProFAR) isomerase
MWQALAPAIEIIRGRTVTVTKGKRRITRKLGRLYARQFQSLNDEYMAWLSGKPADHQTAALGGIQALFG